MVTKKIKKERDIKKGEKKKNKIKRDRKIKRERKKERVGESRQPSQKTPFGPGSTHSSSSRTHTIKKMLHFLSRPSLLTQHAIAAAIPRHPSYTLVVSILG